MKGTLGVGAALVGLFLITGTRLQTRELLPADGRAHQVVRIGEMSVARAAHQATVLRNGRVLVTGGCADPGCEQMLSSAELYDPATRSFRRAGRMNAPRASHAATLLVDGRVLITGGWTGRRTAASAEIFDPQTGRFTTIGDANAPWMSHSAVPLPGGGVLLCCNSGSEGVFAEIFDPATSTFSPVSAARTPAGAYVAVALADGRVLVTGGEHKGEALRLAEIYDPATGEFQPTGDMAVPRVKHAMALLRDGRVVVIGGSSGARRNSYRSTELYDPATGSFARGPDMRWPRHKLRDAVAVLRSGSVLVGGGATRPEIYDTDTGNFVPVQGQLSGLQEFAAANVLPNGDVLILGGYDEQIRPSASAWLVSEER